MSIGRYWYFLRRGFKIPRAKHKARRCRICDSKLVKAARGRRCINQECDDGRR